LSGGISIENIEGIKELEGMNLFALDVNSSVEDLPGVKNLENIQSLLKILNH
jgi:phosphoribosylanthranilate isomerase